MFIVQPTSTPVDEHLEAQGALLAIVKRAVLADDGLAQFTGDWWQLSPSVFTRSQAVARVVAPPCAQWRR